MSNRTRRIESALWGLFAGDALAMPAHWFYRIENIREAFNGGLRGYQEAPNPHPESFMVGMSYQPDPRGTLSLPSQSRRRREYGGVPPS